MYGKTLLGRDVAKSSRNERERILTPNDWRGVGLLIGANQDSSRTLSQETASSDSSFTKAWKVSKEVTLNRRRLSAYRAEHALLLFYTSISPVIRLVFDQICVRFVQICDVCHRIRKNKVHAPVMGFGLNFSRFLNSNATAATVAFLQSGRYRS